MTVSSELHLLDGADKVDFKSLPIFGLISAVAVAVTDAAAAFGLITYGGMLLAGVNGGVGLPTGIGLCW